MRASQREWEVWKVEGLIEDIGVSSAHVEMDLRVIEAVWSENG